MLSRIRSLEGLRIEELDSALLTGNKPCNILALEELERMRDLPNNLTPPNLETSASE